MLTSRNIGLRPPRVRDVGLRDPHRSLTIQHEAQALHLHLRESYNSQVTVWFEGTKHRNPDIGESLMLSQITFIFILILFIDSVNRVYRVQLELSQAKHQQGVA